MRQKKCVMAVLIFVMISGFTGCFAQKITGGAADAEINESEFAEDAVCKVSGTIAVSSEEEQNAVDHVVHTIFNALEEKDEAAIRELFSPYSRENAKDLDTKIKELIEFYPGADGGYDGAAISSEGNDYGVRTHVLDIILDIENAGKEYKMTVCLQMRNDVDPSQEGVHLIEVMTTEKMTDDFYWKDKEDVPGVYVLE